MLWLENSSNSHTLNSSRRSVNRPKTVRFLSKAKRYLLSIIYYLLSIIYYLKKRLVTAVFFCFSFPFRSLKYLRLHTRPQQNNNLPGYTDNKNKPIRIIAER